MDLSLPPDRAAQVHQLFDELIDLEPKARAVRLQQIVQQDAALGRAVEALLDADAENGAVLGGYQQLVQAYRHAVIGHPTRGEDLVGQTIAPYTILERIGGGGMGEVYKAWDTRLDRTVALKFLPPHLSAHDGAKQRFVQEAKAASVLDHPNICTIYEIGEAPARQLFIAMACYGGETLADKLARGPLDVEHALRYATHMADGLHRAHSAGIVHRDIKPANVMITEHDQVKLLDFGIAKIAAQELTRTGARMGTVAYMSPEQARSKPVDHRVDIWALGVVLYEMLTGQRPFQGEHEQTILYAILNEEPVPVTDRCPDVPDALAQIIDRALQKDPADRYGSMSELQDDLRRIRQPGLSSRRRPVRRARSRTRLFASGALVLVLLTLAVWQFMGRQGASVGSVAVLPLTDLAGHPDAALFADGMTEALITNLGSVEALRVISRTSAMQYKGVQKPVAEIASELGVDAVVEGSVQLTDGQVGISVQLVEAATDRILWARSYERPLRNILQLQRQVALDIAQEVAAQLTPEETAYLTAAPTVVPASYQRYLLGLHFRNQETPATWQQAARYFESAIALDSSFAPAYAGLAEVYTQLGERWAPEARRAIDEALALDPHLPDALVALGLIREMLEWDWTGAEQAFRQAIAANPSDGEARHELGLLLMRQRRFDEALAEVQRSVTIDPLFVRFRNGVADVHLFSRRYPEAIALLQESLKIEPDNGITYWRLGLAYLGQERYAEAVEAFRRMIELGSYQTYGYLGHAYAVAGRRSEAEAVLQDLLDRRAQAGPDAAYAAWNIALVYVGLGDHTRALDWLEQAFEEHSNLFVYAAILPNWDPLHHSPRFQALLRHVGLDG